MVGYTEFSCQMILKLYSIHYCLWPWYISQFLSRLEHYIQSLDILRFQACNLLEFWSWQCKHQVLAGWWRKWILVGLDCKKKRLWLWFCDLVSLWRTWIELEGLGCLSYNPFAGKFALEMYELRRRRQRLGIMFWHLSNGEDYMWSNQKHTRVSMVSWNTKICGCLCSEVRALSSGFGLLGQEENEPCGSKKMFHFFSYVEIKMFG